MNVLLISANTVRELTAISDNVNDKHLIPSIKETQDMEFQPIVGSPLFNKLCMLVKDGSISAEENEKYKNLLDFAKYYLAYATVAKLAVTVCAHIDNMGVMQSNDEHTQNYSLKEIFQLSQHYQNKADYYLLRLQNYVCKNCSDFDELRNYNVHDMHKQLNSASSSGLWLGGARGRSKQGLPHCHKH